MGGRFFARLHSLADHLLGLAGNRLALFGLELREETERLLAHLALLLAIALFAGMGLLFTALALLVLAWQHDVLLAAACGVALFFSFGAVVGGGWLWLRVRQAPPAFAVTRAEFELDRQTLHHRAERQP